MKLCLPNGKLIWYLSVILYYCELNSIETIFGYHKDSELNQSVICSIILCYRLLTNPKHVKIDAVKIFLRDLKGLCAISVPQTVTILASFWDREKVRMERIALIGKSDKEVSLCRRPFLLWIADLGESCSIKGRFCLRINSSDIHCRSENRLCINHINSESSARRFGICHQERDLPWPSLIFEERLKFH